MSSQHVPYVLGYTHVTMSTIQWACHLVTGSESHKSALSGDWGLQLDPMNAELVVIADQICRGEYVLASCTHRPSSQQSRENLNTAILAEEDFLGDGG